MCEAARSIHHHPLVTRISSETHEASLASPLQLSVQALTQVRHVGDLNFYLSESRRRIRRIKLFSYVISLVASVFE
jgi:hypothetical protein